MRMMKVSSPSSSLSQHAERLGYHILFLFTVLVGLISFFKKTIIDPRSSLVRNSQEIFSSTYDRDFNLQHIQYQVGTKRRESAWVYVEPNITLLYKKKLAEESSPEYNKVQQSKKIFKGQTMCKFINLSNQSVQLYWKPQDYPMAILAKSLEPMTATGLTAFVGDQFYFYANKETTRKWTIQANQNLYWWDPIHVHNFPDITQANLRRLDEDDPILQERYLAWRQTLEFAQVYKEWTGRSYLSAYRRPPPQHAMVRADYFGQEHVIPTRETHFVQIPSQDHIMTTTSLLLDQQNSSDTILLPDYREEASTRNLTMTVLSVAPRVLEIKDFLSKTEVQHIQALATGKLRKSQTGQQQSQATQQTRTSRNTWIPRDESLIIDSIYRRAANVLGMDESLLRQDDDSDGRRRKSAAEPLQVVHYTEGQEYKPHYDFGFPDIETPGQPTRFATLLFYLNDDMEGGETAFPQWRNAHTTEPLKVQPQLGKALLFYSMLPDGNMDELSQHAALPVIKGEKMIANMWIWDPQFDIHSLK